MKVGDLPEIQARKEVVAREQTNITIAACVLMVLACAAVQRAVESCYDHVVMISCVASFAMMQLAFAKYRMDQASPQKIEAALKALKERRVEVSVNGARQGNLASYIKSQCTLHSKKLEEVEWLLSTVTPRAVKVSLTIGNTLSLSQDGTGDK